MKYSVIIVSYNCLEPLKRCLQSVKKHSQNTEIIVVDNHSEDGTAQLLSEDTAVKVVLNKVNRGFSKACNQGAESATGDILVFLNPDTVVTPEWLNNMSPYLGLPNVGAVGPTSNYVAGLQKIQAHYQGPWSGLSGLDDFARNVHQQNRQKGIRTKLLIGFCLMIHKDVFQTLGGMDENLFLGNDDLDLSWRLQLQNKELVVATDVFVFHEGQKSFQTEPNEKISQLVQESTDALYQKMINHYGGQDKVPSSEEIWGMNWFQPNKDLPARRDSNKPLQDNPFSNITSQKMEDNPNGSDEKVSIIYYKSDSSDPEAEKISFESLNNFNGEDLVFLNHSGSVEREPEGLKGLYLNIPRSRSFYAALKKAVTICDKNRVLFVKSGIELSKFAQEFILKTASPADSLIFPIVGADSAGDPNHPIPAAFLAKKNWIYDKLIQWTELEFEIEFGKSFPAPSEEIRIPHLKFSGTSAVQDNSPVPGPEEPQDPVGHTNQSAANDINYDQLPYSLRQYVQEARYPVFVNSKETKTLDLSGNQADLSKADLVVFRYFDDFKDHLPVQLRAVKRQSPNLKRLILLVLPYKDESQNVNPITNPEGSKSILVELDKTLWENQFAVEGLQSYSSDSEVTYQKEPDTEKSGFQILCAPRASNYDLEKKVSIIILGFNQVAFTKKCVTSIQTHTKQNYELILVDNGSDDETLEYFNSIQGAVVISNKENRGVAKGWNQALEKSTGDYVLIFNNDTIVTENWLENMVRLAESNPGIGIVGPRSNNISGPQVTPDLNIKTEADIQSAAQTWQQNNDLSAMPFERITGFCMLIPRAAFEKIGYFDERFGKGNFEDDDYCLRAKYLGYRLLICNDSFVFHFGSVSYSHDSVDWKHLMEQNAKKFQEKWKDGRKGVEDTFKEAPNSNVTSLVEQAFQNYQDNNLNQARLLFLKAVEADPNLSEGYNGLGIIAFHENNFQDALTLFRRALELDPTDKDVSNNIMDLLEASCNPEERVQCLNALMLDFPDNPVFKSAIEKQTPVSPAPESNWRERVEVLIREKRYQEALDNIEPQLKSDRDLATCFNYLGIISYECKDLEAAWNHFKRSLEINMMDEDVLINFFDTGISIGKEKEVLKTFESVFDQSQSDQKFSEIKQSYFQLKLAQKRNKLDAKVIISNREKNIAGENLIREGMLDKAWGLFEDVLMKDPENFRSLNNLGLLSWYHEDAQGAWNFFTKALQVNPSYGDALINSFDVALFLKKIKDYEPYLERFLEADSKNKEALEIKAHIQKGENEMYNIEKFEDIDPVNDKLTIAEQALDQGNHNAATLNFLEVLENRPDCSTAYNGLGVVAFQKKMYKEAFKLVQLAVELNPLNSTHLMNLWEISRVLGNESEVIERLSSALQIDPSMQEIKEVVDSYSV